MFVSMILCLLCLAAILPAILWERSRRLIVRPSRMCAAAAAFFALLAMSLLFHPAPSTAAAAVRPAAAGSEIEPVLTAADVVNHCGKPARITTTTSGQGKNRGVYTWLWYPKARTQIELAAFPEDQARYRGPAWIAAYPLSSTGKAGKDDMPYDPDQLAGHLPCAATWAHDAQARMLRNIAAVSAAHPAAE